MLFKNYYNKSLHTIQPRTGFQKELEQRLTNELHHSADTTKTGWFRFALGSVSFAALVVLITAAVQYNNPVTQIVQPQQVSAEELIEKASSTIPALENLADNELYHFRIIEDTTVDYSSGEGTIYNKGKQTIRDIWTDNINLKVIASNPETGKIVNAQLFEHLGGGKANNYHFMPHQELVVGQYTSEADRFQDQLLQFPYSNYDEQQGIASLYESGHILEGLRSNDIFKLFGDSGTIEMIGQEYVNGEHAYVIEHKWYTSVQTYWINTENGRLIKEEIDNSRDTHMPGITTFTYEWGEIVQKQGNEFTLDQFKQDIQHTTIEVTQVEEDESNTMTPEEWDAQAMKECIGIGVGEEECRAYLASQELVRKEIEECTRLQDISLCPSQELFKQAQIGQCFSTVMVGEEFDYRACYEQYTHGEYECSMTEPLDGSYGCGLE